MKSRRPNKRHRRPAELLTAYDDNMNEIGVFPRPQVHYNRMWHRVVQCWIIGKTQDGVRVYLQRRSFEKKSHPGRYDICAGGHVSAGESPMTAVIREIREETGLILQEKYLKEIGEYREDSGKDREIATIYVHFEIDPPFYPGDEVIYMVSADLEEFRLLSEGKVDEITVVPAIRTGPMKEEAFRVGPQNFCNHRSFLEVVYPYLKEHCLK
ncbi:MAG: NUDIX domain-containing protein [Anaerovoracaceae bacterium]